MVPEAVPLGGLLWVEVVLVVESDALGNPLDTVLEWSATETWSSRVVSLTGSHPIRRLGVLVLPGGFKFSMFQFKHTRSPVWICVCAARATNSGVRRRSIPSPSSSDPAVPGQNRLLSGRSSNVSGRLGIPDMIQDKGDWRRRSVK